MDPFIPFRAGSEQALAAEFLRISRHTRMESNSEAFKDPDRLRAEDVLAVQFADIGAQGDPGSLLILCRCAEGVRILYGSYASGELDLDAVLQKLPFLKCLDSRYRTTPPYPFGGKLEIPEGWAYVYVGALNHLFVRESLADRTGEYIKAVMEKAGRWMAFFVLAWFCGAEFAS